jgi:Outer membrane protein beta-barrel domain
MRSWLTLPAAVLVLASTTVLAQETAGPGKLETTFIPGGAIFFVSANNGPEFGSYHIGETVTLNVNRFVGLEGEVGGALGITQDLRFGGSITSQKTPDMLGYSGNIVFSAPVRRRVVPYATAGIGGLTMFARSGLDIPRGESFLTGNAGGGVKWYANALWGVRVDYRFMAVRSAESASTFFGQSNRFGQRFYGGVIVNLIR